MHTILSTVQVVTYMTKDKFKQNRKKTFKGHNTAGYACQVNWSPDSKYVMSGVLAIALGGQTASPWGGAVLHCSAWSVQPDCLQRVCGDRPAGTLLHEESGDIACIVSNAAADNDFVRLIGTASIVHLLLCVLQILQKTLCTCCCACYR
eukprot:GHUV01031017.1.p1 GENE.GHUV01031017.1~~GHUV01031017.1.p1  ORF type:complete len:149 (-),score=27.33 GHUV01031017.1:363-809(-)